MKTLEVKNMDIKINLNANLISVIGPESSGKTYLLKKLINRVDNSDVYIDDIAIKEYDISFLRNNIFVVLNDDTFKCEYVAEELFYYLNVLGHNIDVITKKIDDFIKYFKLEGIENKKISALSLELRSYVKILSMLITDPSLLGIDNLFPYLTNDHIELILKYINKKKINLINIINDGKYLMYSKDVLVLNEGKCVLKGTVDEVLSGNSILPYMGINLPFVVELSSNLILYGLIDKIFFDMDKLVDVLWK